MFGKDEPDPDPTIHNKIEVFIEKIDDQNLYFGCRIQIRAFRPGLDPSFEENNVSGFRSYTL